MKKKNFILVICIFGLGIIGKADIGFKAPSVDGTTNVNTPELGAIVFDTLTNLFWGNNASSSSPNWVELSSPSQLYSSGYFNSGYTWSMTTTGGGFHAFSNTASGTFYVENQSSLNVTAPSSNGMGITFTPVSSSAVYRITFKINCYNSPTTDGFGMRLYDSANSLEVDETDIQYIGETVLSGLYVPGTTSQVTVLVQGAVTSGGIYCGNSFGNANASWDIQQVK